MSQMLQYLKFMDDVEKKMKQKTIEAVVLAHGKEYTPPVYPRPEGIKKGKDKECFRNSYLLAAQRGWTYVEGFAIPHVVPAPLAHAWVVDDGGNVIETTWYEPAHEYYGIALDMQFIHRVMFETSSYGALDYRSAAFRERFANADRA